MRKLTTAVAPLLLVLSLVPADLGAQANLTFEAYAGAAQFGRFLEQRVVGAGQRELSAANALAVGGSLGISPGARTAVRIAFTWSSSDLEFQDDTGNGSSALDVEELADLSTSIFSLEVLRFLADQDRWIVPFVTAGVSGGLLSLDGTDGGQILVNGDDDSLWRFGGVGGVGLQIHVTPALGVRLELNNFALKNPFDGEDAFRVATGEVLDEPETARVSRLTLGLIYLLGR